MSDGATVQQSNDPTANMTEQQLVLYWDELKTQLATVKETEGNIRKRIFGMKFPQPREGTNTWDYGDGYELKGSHKISRKFIIPENFPPVATPSGQREATIVDAVDSMIDELRAAGNEGTFIADRIVKWTPTLSETEYKQLTDTQKKIVDRYIEAKDGSPTLEFKRPKA